MFLEFLENLYIDSIVEEISNYLKEGEKLLDIGCGNGKISYRLKETKNIHSIGVDRFSKSSLIPFIKIDSKKLPFKNKEFDASIIINVLHHTKNIEEIVKEAFRVSKEVIIIDHFYETGLQKVKLEIIDFMRNLSARVPTPFNFLTLEEWKRLFKSLDLKIVKMNTDFKLGKLDILKNVFFVVK